MIKLSFWQFLINFVLTHREMEQERNRKSLGDLPLELIELICEYCDDRALLERLPRVAKVFWTILSNDNFWRRASDAKKMKYLVYDASKSCRYNYQKNLPYYPVVQWSELTCHGEVKDRLRENFLLPIKFPNLFVGSYRTSRAALLYGPHGVDKSILAKAVACEAKATFFSLRCSDLFRKNEGNPEKTLRDLFARARSHTPAILFIDEIESIDGTSLASSADTNRRVKVEFLVLCQQPREGVYVIAATEAPWEMCPAVRRRFEQRIWVDLPDLDTRVKLLKQHLETLPNDLTDEDITELGKLTVNYSSEDILYLIRDASMRIVSLVMDATHFKLVQVPSETDPNTMCEYYTPCSPGDESGSPMTINDVPQGNFIAPKLNKRHLELTFAEVKPLNSKEQLDKYEEFKQNFGQ